MTDIAVGTLNAWDKFVSIRLWDRRDIARRRDLAKDDELTGGAIDTCFHCHRRIPRGDHRILWHGSEADGSTVTLVLHTRCAVAFVVRFVRDVHEADLHENITEAHRRV